VSVLPPSRPRLSRLETWGLLASLALLLALGATGLFALLPKSEPPASEADDGPGNPSASYHAEQAVDAWHGDRWYPAHVHSANGGRYFITYDDFSISWHEWVGARRLRKRK
jgi:hypothetical protein